MRTMLFILLAALSSAFGEPGDAVTRQQADALFAWYDELPPPSVKDSKLVRIWRDSGEWGTPEGGVDVISNLVLLLRDDDAEFQVAYSTGGTSTLKKHGAQPTEDGFVGWREIPFAEIREFVSNLETNRESDAWYWFEGGFFSPPVDRCSRLFELARWCAQRGESDLADKILFQLQRWRDAQDGQGAVTLEEALQREFADRLLQSRFLELGIKDVERSSVLDDLRKIVMLCPKANLDGEKEAIRVLGKMAEEERRHLRMTDAQLDALSLSDRTRELVFRLREESRPQELEWMVAVEHPWPSNHSARGLSELGVRAIPALREALQDESFTREAYFSREKGAVMRVQDIAADLLEKLAGFNFYPDDPLSKPVSEVRATRFAMARAWCEGVEKLGERDYLIECVKSPSPLAARCAARLVSNYPADAIPAILEGIHAQKAVQDRTAMAKTLLGNRDSRCVDFFATEAISGAEIADRVAAAEALREIGDSRGVAAMCTEWRKMKSTYARASWPAIHERHPFNEPFAVAQYLVATDAPEAILTLGEDASALPAGWSKAIIAKIGPERWQSDTTAGSRRSGAKAAAEDVLAGFLEDKTPARQTTSWNNGPIFAARICDLAASTLHVLWPSKYGFDHWLSPEARFRQCLASANLRAKESGEPLPNLPAESNHLAPLPNNPATIVSLSCDAPAGSAARRLADQLKELSGEPLSSEKLIADLSKCFSVSELGAAGLSLTAARFSDRPGVVLDVESIPGGQMKGAARCSANLSCVIQNVMHLGLQVGWGPASEWVRLEKWRQLHAAVDRALSEPSSVAFSITVTISASSKED